MRKILTLLATVVITLPSVGCSNDDGGDDGLDEEQCTSIAECVDGFVWDEDECDCVPVTGTPDAGMPSDAADEEDTSTGSTDTGSADTGSVDMGGGDPVVTLDNEGNCFEFSDDPDIPLAIDGAFDAESKVWRRPHDDPPVCPATALLPETAASVPYVGFAFCNNDAVDHVYDFEFLAADGPDGEPPLDDPYLILYEGEGLPDDHLQCLAVNDDIPDAIDAKDSEILGINVPAGGAITVMATTFTFDPTDGTGMGGYVLVVSNAD